MVVLTCLRGGFCLVCLRPKMSPFMCDNPVITTTNSLVPSALFGLDELVASLRVLFGDMLLREHGHPGG